MVLVLLSAEVRQREERHLSASLIPARTTRGAVRAEGAQAFWSPGSPSATPEPHDSGPGKILASVEQLFLGFH